MESAIKVPLTERINFRMLTFIVIIGCLIGWPVYTYLDSALSGGIKDRGDYLEVDLKAMSTFTLDQTNGTLEDVPEKWRALNGKKVMVEGEMWEPQSAGPGVSEFQLVYSIAKCCFSGPPQIQHFVQAKAMPGKQLFYYSGLVRVVGTLRVDMQRSEGKISQVYALDVESIDPID